MEIWTPGFVRCMWNITYNLLIIRHFLIPSLSCLFSSQRCSMACVQGLFKRTKGRKEAQVKKGNEERQKER